MSFQYMPSRLAGIVIFLLVLPPAANAHDTGREYIESFDTSMSIAAGGALDVRHVVDVHPHGDEIRRGIFFELPDELGPLSGFSAAVDGVVVEPEVDDGRLIAAAPAPLTVHETHRIEIRYRAEAPLQETGEGSVVLRWAPIIDQFELPWREASVTLGWSAGRMPARLPADGEHAGGAWRKRFEGPLATGSGAPDMGTLKVRWSSGTWPADSVRRSVAHWSLRTALVVSMLVLFGVLHSMWRAVGRDPDIGRVAASPKPPDDISPAAARYIERMDFDQTAFVAALVSLRVKGRIRIGIDADAKQLDIERVERPERQAREQIRVSPGEKALENALFADGPRVELAPGGKVGQRAMKALSKTLGTEHRGRHFVTNNRQRTIAFGLGVALAVGGIAVLISELGAVMERDRVAVVLGFLAVAAGTFLPMIYFELLKAPTRAGVAVRREIAALKEHLEDSAPCRESSRHFVELLPWAIALDAEKTWQARFGDRLDENGDADVAETVRWYRELVDEFDSATAAVPVIAAAAGATAAPSASAGGASAGGV